MYNSVLTYLFLCLTLFELLEIVSTIDSPADESTKFGYGKPHHLIEEIHGFADAKQFLQNYVFTLTPLKMTKAVTSSRAYSLWGDDYLDSMTQHSPDNDKITVETIKKENRREEVLEMDFSKFLKIYNGTEYYMVNSVPSFLRKDVTFPCSIQCEDLIRNDLVEDVMWFSSGGTKSVVHTDSVDNIICVYRGEKTFIMIDPSLYKDQVDMDHPEGAYSGVDVDNVDYTVYPGLAEIEYYHVNLSAGDCLFIPYKWIHQVRSYNSNIAVNIWWNHHSSLNLDLTSCTSECDPDLTLEEVQFHGFGDLIGSLAAVRDQIEGFLGIRKKTDYTRFFQLILGGELQFLDSAEIKDMNSTLFEMFDLLDRDKNGIVNMEELKMATDEDWKKVQHTLQEIDNLLDGVEGEVEELDGGEELDDDINDFFTNTRDEL
ncbi:hypothetical protein ScPMuIL_012979 [Solemya velum]